MSEQRLPAGWTIERVRQEAQAPEATWGDLLTPVFWEGDDDQVPVSSILVLGDYALVQETDSDDWAMGSLAGGRVTLWATCGELRDALHGL